MKRGYLWNACIVLFWIMMISGCATFRFAPPTPGLYTDQTYTPAEYKADLEKYQNPEIAAAERTRIRDKIVYLTAREIDKNYREFKNSFFGERAATETAFDIMQIGLGTAGTIAGGITTANILAAISTGIAGSRLSFNKNFFKEKSPDLLLSRMDALRASQWLQIYRKLQKDDPAYLLYEAERDLIAYFEKGTLQAAFQDVIAESGAAQQKAEAAISKQIQAKYGRFIEPIASESELGEVDKLYNEFLKLKSGDKENRAKKIIAKFKALQPDISINPGVSDSSDLEGVIYLYTVAIQGDENSVKVRDCLVSAFKAAQQ